MLFHQIALPTYKIQTATAECLVMAGSPFDDELVGPSSGAWGRAQDEAGRVAFLTTDGGTTALPLDGELRAARVLRLEF